MLKILFVIILELSFYYINNLMQANRPKNMPRNCISSANKNRLIKTYFTQYIPGYLQKVSCVRSIFLGELSTQSFSENLLHLESRHIFALYNSLYHADYLITKKL